VAQVSRRIESTYFLCGGLLGNAISASVETVKKMNNPIFTETQVCNPAKADGELFNFF
jgi:hypothetical protein